MELLGYETGFIATVINVGVRAHLKVLADHQQNGRLIHRSMEWEGKGSRRRGRDNWFQLGGGTDKLYSSVIFVPSTPGSALARQLQQQEALNNQGRTHQFQIIEKAGVLVRNFLARN